MFKYGIRELKNSLCSFDTLNQKFSFAGNMIFHFTEKSLRVQFLQTYFRVDHEELILEESFGLRSKKFLLHIASNLKIIEEV